MAFLIRPLAIYATFTSVLALVRVDTHFHAVPPEYAEAVAAAGGDPSGFPTPEWTLDSAIKFMNEIDTDIGVISITAPGVPIAGTGQAARDLARSMNDYFEDITTETEYSRRLGFFGVLPDWQDVNGTLAELDYLYQEQKLCNGVTVYTTYGDKLLGDPLFVPIWDRLQQYKALVFVHPAVIAIEPKFIAGALFQPVVDYTLATTRTAVDLAMTKTMSRCPDVDFILSHAGGTLPFLAERVFGSLLSPITSDAVDYDSEQARRDFARFYHDTTLGTSAAQLHGLLDFTDPSRIIFGSDWPYAPRGAIDSFLEQYDEFVANDDRGSMVTPEMLRKNPIRLLNKHAMGKVF